MPSVFATAMSAGPCVFRAQNRGGGNSRFGRRAAVRFTIPLPLWGGVDPGKRAWPERATRSARTGWGRVVDSRTVRVGFEPTVTRRPRRFSRPVRSTAPLGRSRSCALPACPLNSGLARVTAAWKGSIPGTRQKETTAEEDRWDRYSRLISVWHPGVAEPMPSLTDAIVDTDS